MRPGQSVQVASIEELPEAELVRLAQRGNGSAFRVIIQRHNRRLYRVARSVLRDNSEAEDAVQEAYVHAFTGLAGFRGGASLSSWLTRITLNEALGRRRRQRPTVDLAVIHALQERPDPSIAVFPLMNQESDPERAAELQDIRALLERAIDELPAPFRIVFIMRAVEELSIDETAQHLGLRPETVKTRLHRARRLLRKALDKQLSSVFTGAFPFDGTRCTRITERVLARLGIAAAPPAT